MKKLNISILAIFLVYLLGCKKDNGNCISQGEVMVDFMDSISKDSVEVIINNKNLTYLKVIGPILNIHLVKCNPGDEQFWSNELIKEKTVEEAQPNHCIYLN